MPRKEQPLPSEDTELGRFAADLRRLRDKAGKPSYRDLAARAHYSSTALSDAAGGKKLPTLAVTLAYVAACGGDEAEWEQRWRNVAAPPEEPAGEAPYVGLKAFQEEDADRFFGREKLTAKLVDLVARRPFAGVFGASGSGKSSLLRAGLVARLESAVVFTPGAHPREECAVQLARLTGESVVRLREELADPDALRLLVKQHDEDLVLVVDQFEEVFTLCEAEERDWFVEALIGAPHVVIGVRADFYGHISRHPDLVDALEGAQLLVGPMTPDELRRAITEPAQHVGGKVETALVARLVADVAGQVAALPLVQHALTETWRRRRGLMLTLVGYEEAGGVEHAIARTAEAVFNDLPSDKQSVARQIFLRLIALGEGTEDTKRRAARADLDAKVLERLATARLVTLSEEHVELTHEALIRSWPRLRDWIAEDRAKLRVHHQLTEAATQWDGRDPDVLYQGARLEQAGELDAGALTAPERAFLHASKAKTRRRARRVRIVIGALSALVVLLAGTMVVAVVQSREVARQQEITFARSAAESVRQTIRRDPKTALRVAAAAHRLAPATETRDALLTADAAFRRYTPDRHNNSVLLNGNSLTTSPPSIAGSPLDSEFVFQDVVHSLDSTQPPIALQGQLLSRSADGKRLLVSRPGVTELLDFSDPAHPRALATYAGRFGLPIQAAGDLFVGTLVPPRGQLQPDNKVRLWTYDGAGGFRESILPSPSSDGAYLVSTMLSSDGRTLVLTKGIGKAAAAEFWRLDGAEPRLVHSRKIGDTGLFRLVLSPDGTLLALHNPGTSSIELWDLSDPANPVLATETRALPRTDGAMAFSADGLRLAANADNGFKVWDVSDRRSLKLIASFDGFERTGGLSYLPTKDAFVSVENNRDAWFLRMNADQVIADLCKEPDMRLSDDEWDRYFPGVARKEVC